MASRDSPVRKSTEHGSPTKEDASGSTPDFAQLFAEQLAASMPNIVSELRNSIFQNAVELATMMTHSVVRNGLLPPMENRQNCSRKRGRGSRCNDTRKRNRRNDAPKPIQSYAAVVPDAQVKHPKCEKCGRHHDREVECWVCARCKKLGHTVNYCRVPKGNCYECGVAGHRRDKCPKLSASGSDSGSRGRAFALGAQEAQEDPHVVTGTFLINDQPAFILFDFGADRSFISLEFRS